MEISMRNYLIKTLLSASVSFALAGNTFAVEVPAGTELAKAQSVTINNGVEPTSLDPQKMEGKSEGLIAYQLFEGLVTKDSAGKTEPGVAESWDSSPDFKTWTFHLRENAKWSNGDPVTAQDFVYSWQRLADPKNASPYASYLTFLQVENAQDIIEGKKAPSTLSVEAKDDHTFVIHLTNPVPYAVGLTNHFALLPVNKKAIEKFGDKWVRKGNLVGNGAYTLADHVINEKIVFERNPLYWNNDKSVINQATFLAIDNPTVDVTRYRAGDLDITGDALPPEQFKKLKKEMPDQLFTPRTLSTYTYMINNEKKPFTDIRVRKALNYALDRKIITDKVLGQGQTPTYVFTPTYIAEGGKIQQPAYSKLPMTERNAEAIKLLKEAGFSKDKPLSFSLLYNTSENHKKIAIAAASIWKKNTDGLVNVKLTNQEWKTYLVTRRTGEFDVARVGWSADYNQATTFGNYFVSNSSNNVARYKSDAYDKVIADSYKAKDQSAREAFYAQAEEQLAKDFAVIPVYNYVSPRLVKPYVKGFEGKDPQDDILLKNLYIVKH